MPRCSSADIISGMVEGEGKNVIKNGQLLMLYGYTTFEKVGSEKFNEIANKLRSTARFLIKYKESNGQTLSISDIVEPTAWDNTIDCMKRLVKQESGKC